MKYQTQREKARKFIEDNIIPTIKKQDVDYYKVLNVMRKDLRIDEKIIKEEIRVMIENKEVKEIRLLTIGDEEVKPFFKRIVSKEKAAEKTLKEMEKEVKKK